MAADEGVDAGAVEGGGGGSGLPPDMHDAPSARNR
jgi:hypothetical protein